MNAWIIAALLALLTPPAQSQPEPQPQTQQARSYSGNAYDLDSGDLLYRETHLLFSAAGTRERVVLYRCPDGRPFARKRIRDDGDSQAPDFDMRDARLGYREGVRRDAGERVAYVQRSAQQNERDNALQVPADGVIDAGFDNFVRNHWQALLDGDTLHFDFLVPSKRAFYAFKLARRHHGAGHATVRLRLSLGAWYAFLLPHIDVVYDRATRRLLRYEGLSNIRNHDLKNLDVRIEFPHAPVSVPMARVATAMHAPLTDTCKSVRSDTVASAAGQ